ncbi:hypothetical protein [Streptomyces sp. R08]|uniref:Uncharacterized protein n=1 Tax=Streptomyces sp. R08 TaxID=3238624 RepID=A0AB39MFH3_9ACTN
MRKAVETIERGEWVTFGNMAYQVGDTDGVDGDGRAWLFIGYSWYDFPAGERIKIHTDK